MSWEGIRLECHVDNGRVVIETPKAKVRLRGWPAMRLAWALVVCAFDAWLDGGA